MKVRKPNAITLAAIRADLPSRVREKKCLFVATKPYGIPRKQQSHGVEGAVGG
jgi:hypothetical protein